jgi:glycosyltransferase involved in cell wall biosynthesis
LGLPENKHIIILQGTGINIDRGAEEACLAMQYIENSVLLIIGSGDVFPKLKEIITNYHLENKVIIKNKLPFAELRQFTINSDLGLAIDKNTNINYQFSLPNKIFDYIHSEIPILASKLTEIQQIIDTYKIGYYIDNHEPKHIAEKINSIFSNTEQYNKIKINTLEARTKLNWENEEKVLLEVINRCE